MASVNILYLLALVLSIVLKSIHDVDGKSDVPCFFIFGDSLVDSGNNNHLKNKGKVNYLPYGIDFPDGPTGRFNNGRTVPDVLGISLKYAYILSYYLLYFNSDSSIQGFITIISNLNSS